MLLAASILAYTKSKHCMKIYSKADYFQTFWKWIYQENALNSLMPRILPIELQMKTRGEREMCINGQLEKHVLNGLI